MSMFQQIRNSVNSILPRLYADEDLTTTITWRVFQGSEFNEDLGVNEDTYTDHSSIKAIKVEKEIGSTHVRGSIPPSVYSMATGEVEFLFRYDDVPSGVSIRDMIVDTEANLTYNVKKIYPVFGLIVKVAVMGYA